MNKKILLLLLIGFLTVNCSKSNDDNPASSSFSIKKNVGYSANDILSASKFSSLVIDLMYVNGYKPTDETLVNLKSFIEERTYKTSVIIQPKEIDISLQNEYTLEEIDDIEDDNRSLFTSGNQLAISAIFINGKSSKDTQESKVLGAAYRNTSFVIFEETIRSNSDGPFEPNRVILESTVVLHEFCHLLGLVNRGTPMVGPHEDAENSSHCNVDQCLMYYKVENAYNVLNHTNTTDLPELDSFCLADLKANGGR